MDNGIRGSSTGDNEETNLHRLAINGGAQEQSFEEASAFSQRCFSEEAGDVTLHFQIVSLDEQYFIWVGCNSAAFGNLFTAVPTRFDPQPSVAHLITKGGDNSGALIAQRLSKRTRRQIVLACNLPPDSASLEAFAEKRILQELQKQEHGRATQNASLPASTESRH